MQQKINFFVTAFIYVYAISQKEKLSITQQKLVEKKFQQSTRKENLFKKEE